MHSKKRVRSQVTLILIMGVVILIITFFVIYLTTSAAKKKVSRETQTAKETRMNVTNN